MGAALSSECEVRYVDGKGNSSLGSKSRGELVKQMRGYFANIKSPQSSLSQVSIAGRFVTAKETVRWSSGKGKRSQFSLVVFELDEQQEAIARVWYYPAQR